MARLTNEQMQDVITDLVASKYPYEVQEILSKIDDSDDLAIAVGGALADSARDGYKRGRADKAREVMTRLGLDQ